eukprot:TRINITY_DN33624_c0_g1_i1.p1 TRINITY_DN33624_c0_g1~~TRINITY_DN33624_c0_g1_i1.p1  ORF type:complete len:186 (+),score=33.57 TRINITY_DN33624_c0_g1_i1:59-559(+)
MIPRNTKWADEFVLPLLELSEVVGESRSGVVFMRVSELEEEWVDWSKDQLQSLINIMTDRGLLSRVAGYDGEELRISPDAVRLHTTHIQRMSAFEEEEDANFVDEEIEAERVQVIAKETELRRRRQPIVPPTAPPVGTISTPAPSVRSLRRMYGGDDIRVPISVVS